MSLIYLSHPDKSCFFKNSNNMFGKMTFCHTSEFLGVQGEAVSALPEPCLSPALLWVAAPGTRDLAAAA